MKIVEEIKEPGFKFSPLKIAIVALLITIFYYNHFNTVNIILKQGILCKRILKYEVKKENCTYNCYEVAKYYNVFTKKEVK